MMQKPLTRRGFLRTVSGGIAGTVLFSTVVEESAAQTVESWPQFGYNDARTGHAPENAGPIMDVREKWRFQAPDNVVSTPAVVNDIVYVSSDDGSNGNLYALDIESGEEQWRFQAGGWVSPPTVVSDTVYAGNYDDNVLYALDAESGDEQWRFETGEEVFSSPVVVNGTVYFGSLDNNVYAVEAESGTEKWRFQTDDSVFSSAAVVDNTVYIGSEDNYIYALNSESGDEQWRTEIGGTPSTPAVFNSTVYVVGDSIYALEATSGQEIWRFDSQGGDSSPAVAYDTVYVGTDNDIVYALDAASGTVQWRFQAENQIDSSPAVVSDMVYVGSLDNNLYALDAESGEQQWSFETDGAVESSPAVVDGTVYIGSDDHSAYAITGETQTAQPTPTADEANDDGISGEPTGQDTTSGSPSSPTQTEIPESASLTQQRGTANVSEGSSESPFGVASFTQFGDSESVIRVGGLAAALGLGGGYAAYRRFSSDDNS